jgi:mono/diheme cytochrome c family protein
VRYTRIGHASYAIGAVLVVTAVGVAWARSRTAPEGPPSAVGAAATGPTSAQDVGATVYDAECSGCHGTGEARGGGIPALRGGAVSLFSSEGGREYLIELLLDGRVRKAETGGIAYVESHPGYPRLSDAEVAAVLNHMLVSWGNDALLPRETTRYTATEVAARRPPP